MPAPVTSYVGVVTITPNAPNSSPECRWQAKAGTVSARHLATLARCSVAFVSLRPGLLCLYKSEGVAPSQLTGGDQPSN